mmetsp:Transcript_48135/g.104810  ORF Transcript_48135/g.104810 Transcript_48135/m.104810 type:complete len:165 (-) Transcript_48135:1393-1887(-)
MTMDSLLAEQGGSHIGNVLVKRWRGEVSPRIAPGPKGQESAARDQNRRALAIIGGHGKAGHQESAHGSTEAVLEASPLIIQERQNRTGIQGSQKQSGYWRSSGVNRLPRVSVGADCSLDVFLIGYHSATSTAGKLREDIPLEGLLRSGHVESATRETSGWNLTH